MTNSAIPQVASETSHMGLVVSVVVFRMNPPIRSASIRNRMPSPQVTSETSHMGFGCFLWLLFGWSPLKSLRFPCKATPKGDDYPQENIWGGLILRNTRLLAPMVNPLDCYLASYHNSASLQLVAWSPSVWWLRVSNFPTTKTRALHP